MLMSQNSEWFMFLTVVQMGHDIHISLKDSWLMSEPISIPLYDKILKHLQALSHEDVWGSRYIYTI
jgi:hypothetical protein